MVRFCPLSELILVIHILNNRANLISVVDHLAFTSAPIPTEYYYEGAYGNDATCTAQGFFIQVGTVAAYTNVSLAFYYFLAIRKGFNEAQLQSYRLRFLLCPIILGLAFAFAGKVFFSYTLMSFRLNDNMQTVASRRVVILRKRLFVVVSLDF